MDALPAIVLVVAPDFEYCHSGIYHAGELLGLVSALLRGPAHLSCGAQDAPERLAVLAVSVVDGQPAPASEESMLPVVQTGMTRRTGSMVTAATQYLCEVFPSFRGMQLAHPFWQRPQVAVSPCTALQ